MFCASRPRDTSSVAILSDASHRTYCPPTRIRCTYRPWREYCADSSSRQRERSACRRLDTEVLQCTCPGAASILAAYGNDGNGNGHDSSLFFCLQRVRQNFPELWRMRPYPSVRRTTDVVPRMASFNAVALLQRSFALGAHSEVHFVLHVVGLPAYAQILLLTGVDSWHTKFVC